MDRHRFACRFALSAWKAERLLSEGSYSDLRDSANVAGMLRIGCRMRINWCGMFASSLFVGQQIATGLQVASLSRLGKPSDY